VKLHSLILLLVIVGVLDSVGVSGSFGPGFEGIWEVQDASMVVRLISARLVVFTVFAENV
jgi:hypothetical protein